MDDDDVMMWSGCMWVELDHVDGDAPTWECHARLCSGSQKLLLNYASKSYDMVSDSRAICTCAAAAATDGYGVQRWRRWLSAMRNEKWYGGDKVVRWWKQGSGTTRLGERRGAAGSGADNELRGRIMPQDVEAKSRRIGGNDGGARFARAVREAAAASEKSGGGGAPAVEQCSATSGGRSRRMLLQRWKRISEQRRRK
ncbi:hypothetical protein Scep_030515 [Stephania cephalantha]|uniref:Uncharacterized protein n=1 Tax=Stephania cephalantha TaxID=152367 RepID=A0AAP0HEE9_9MAGN